MSNLTNQLSNNVQSIAQFHQNFPIIIFHFTQHRIYNKFPQVLCFCNPGTMARVRIAEAKRFITECLKAVGANIKAAEQQANLFIYADKIGHWNYGLNKLGILISDIKSGTCLPNNVPEITHEKSSTAWIDTKNVMGATAGCFAMDVAVKKAYETGVGWIAMKASTHNCKPYSFWSQKAAKAGLIGMVFANSALETRRKELYKRRAIQNSGKQDVFSEKTLETSSSGYGFEPSKIAALVDFISGSGSMGAINGATKGGGQPPLQEEPSDDPAAQCFVVVNPACFTLGFESKFMDNQPFWEKQSIVFDQVEVPLDHLEKMTTVDMDDTNLINYEIQVIQSSGTLAKELNVKPIKFMHMFNKGSIFSSKK